MSLTAQAPLSFGITGGFNLSGLPEHSQTMAFCSSNTLESRTQLFVSPVIGITLNDDLNEKISISGDMFYEVNGEETNDKSERTYGNKFVTEQWIIQQYHNIGFSIFPSWHFSVSTLNFSVFAGYEFDYAICGSYNLQSTFVNVQDAVSKGLDPVTDSYLLNPFTYASDDYYRFYNNASRINHQLIGGCQFHYNESISLSLKIGSGNYYSYSVGPLVSEEYYGDVGVMNNYRNLNYSFLFKYYLPEN